MRPAIAEAALVEIEEALAWYAAQSPRAAADFAAALDRAFEQIVLYPRRWLSVSRRHRRCIVDRFPYSVIYQLMADGPTVVAVAHHHRRPGYWRGR